MNSDKIHIDFTKSTFTYGVDTRISGSIFYDNVQLSQDHKIIVEHILRDGVCDNIAESGKSHHTNSIFYSHSIENTILDQGTTTFSFHLKYPNILPEMGIAFHETSSLVKNIIKVSIIKKGIIDREIAKTEVTAPVDWPNISNKNMDMMRSQYRSIEFNQNDHTINNTKNLKKLPWDPSDVVSKEYYENILSSSFIYKLGEISYKNEKILYTIFIVGFISILVYFFKTNAHDFGYDPLNGVFILLVVFGFGFIAIMHGLRWWFKHNTGRSLGFYPILTQDSVPYESILSFLPSQFLKSSINNNQIGDGEFSVAVILRHRFYYTSGKRQCTHESFIFYTLLHQSTYSSINETLSKNIQLPSLTRNLIDFCRANTLLDLDLFLKIYYRSDTVPDKTYEIKII